jgi:Ca2+-binding EF-hand superfamily protein
MASTMASSSGAPPPPPVVRETTMDPSLRAAIAADLRSVDADADGRIGAEELGALLRKHESAFAEGEILELSDLFYSSLGGSSVSISKFLEALDAASGGGGGGGGGAATDGGSLNALGSDGKLKTHPLGIGTCASEYM